MASNVSMAQLLFKSTHTLHIFLQLNVSQIYNKSKEYCWRVGLNLFREGSARLPEK